jgi:hypothetical protein
MKNTLLLLSALLFLASCKKAREANDDKTQQILSAAFEAHGSKVFNTSKVSFDFRDKTYSVERTESQFTYMRSFQDSIGFIEDRLINSAVFTRMVDKEPVDLTEEWQSRYGNSVNSVLYFFQLPLVLNDAAANKIFLGKSQHDGVDYYAIRITFGEQNGGQDFDDIFLYWINKDTNEIDYFAYSYLTDGGGVRFRQAINKRRVEGLLVQDYINFKPESNEIPLFDLLTYFREGKLIEVSRIVNDNVKVTPL